MAPTQRRED